MRIMLKSLAVAIVLSAVLVLTVVIAVKSQRGKSDMAKGASAELSSDVVQENGTIDDPIVKGEKVEAGRQFLGTWRNGFKQAHAEALTFKSWDAMFDWAESGGNAIVLPLRRARSTDLGGDRHDYTDTYAAGYRDACLSIHDEMLFIGGHNSGDTEHFFEMTQDWIRMQNLDEIIPPGHF